MAIVPTDLLDEAEAMVELAETLPEIPRREVLCRTAASRAYYAAFHAAMATARKQGYFWHDAPSGIGSHESLWEWWFVDERPAEDLTEFAAELKAQRVRADYRIHEHFSIQGARQATTLARRIIALLQETT